MTLVTTSTDEARSTALLKALGLDRVQPEQRELALAIANRYGLDPMLRHLVMIEGRPYITRDGLLHVAHMSHQLDGIEVDDPVKTEDGKHWTARCSIYRKDMTRPFTYSGRYPVDGRNKVFAPEMAIKVAEVMALRRAFDIAAPVLEERWDMDAADVPAPPEQPTLADRIASRAEAIQTPPQPEEPTETAEPVEPDIEVEPATEVVLAAPMDEATSETIVEPFQGEHAVAVTPDGAAVDPIADGRQSSGISQDEFARRIVPFERAEVKAMAKQLYPDVRKFADLDGLQLETIAIALELATPAEVSPEPATISLVGYLAAAEVEEETEPDPTPTSGSSEAPTVANGGIALCGNASPLSGNTCTLDAGHKGKVHRHGLQESW